MTRLSFRDRLTLSYAVLAAVVLSLAGTAVLLTIVAIGLRIEAATLDETVAATRNLIDENWRSSDAEIIARIQAQTVRSGVRVITIPRLFAGPPGPGGPGGFFAPGGHGGPPPDFGPFDLHRAMDRLGVHAVPIRLHTGGVLIVPDPTRIGEVMRLFVLVLAAIVVVASATSWFAARWIADQAIAPLVAVTAELRRFARGDFASQPVLNDDTSELGELIEAYNGAVTQVASAFSERERTAQHLRFLLGEAGHELRTPLTVISAYLDVIDDRSEPDAQLRERAFRALRAETMRMRNLVERFMALARLEAPAQTSEEPVDIVDVTRETIERLESVYGHRTPVRLRVDDGDIIVRGHVWEVGEAVGNLVDNALKYGDGSPVDVDIARSAESVRVRVRDGGPGIAPADRERIFQHFFRGENTADAAGSGLGLAIAVRAAARMGGAIELEPDLPTTFRLTLPAYRAPLPTPRVPFG